MAEEKYAAERLDFFYSRLVPGRFEVDREHCIPAVAVYSASQGVLVETDPNTNIPFGPPRSRSIAYVGDEAEEKYAALKSHLAKSGVKPTQIKVTPEFVEWGKALHRVQTPSESLVNLLTPKR